jgi:hypothetical protein
MIAIRYISNSSYILSSKVARIFFKKEPTEEVFVMNK